MDCNLSELPVVKAPFDPLEFIATLDRYTDAKYQFLRYQADGQRSMLDHFKTQSEIELGRLIENLSRLQQKEKPI